MNPVKVILPAAEGVNPVAIIDCAAMPLVDVLGYCSRTLGWSRALLPMGRDEEGRGVVAEIGDLTAAAAEAASLERNIEALPQGTTIRRLVIGNGVLATVSRADGTVLDNAIEAIHAVEDPPLSLAPGFFDEDDDEDWDDDDEEFDDEDEDEEDEDDDDSDADAEEEEEEAKTASAG
jgi:hypothetical protein